MKPIAVLLLVLVAVAALIFGLVTFGGAGTRNPGDPVIPDATASTAKQPGKPAEIDKGPDRTVRTEGKVESVPDRTQIGSDVYANELRVQVVDSEKRPIPEVEVTLTTLRSDDLFAGLDTTREAYQLGPLRTGPDGRVSFVGIEPSHPSYTLVCIHPDYARKESPTVPIGAEGVIEEPPIELAAGATLQGWVKDEQQGPIAGAKLVLEGLEARVQDSRAPDRLETVTDAAGNYTIKNIPRGPGRNLTITAAGFGHLVITTGLNFPDLTPRTRNFTLKVAEMISGRVVGVGNQGLAKAKVMAVCATSTQETGRGDALTDQNGDFRFESLEPGDYSVYTTLKGWRFQPVNRIRSNTANLVIEGMRLATVCGQVVDGAGGAPIQQFSMQLRVYADPSSPTTPIPETKASTFDASGNFCFEGVENGNYVVEAWAPGYAPTRSQNFTVSNDRNVEHVAVRLTHGGSISGRLVDPEKRPLQKALVRTKPPDWTDDDFSRMMEDQYPFNGTMTETRTGADGSFVLKNLSPDQYQIVIEGASFPSWAKAEIAVAEDADTNLGDLTMARGGTLVGTVFDSTGKGVPGAGVMLYASDDPQPHEYQAKTGADGKFTLRHVAHGRYLVRPTPPASASTNPLEEMRIGNDAERQLVIVDDQETKIDLTLPVSTHQSAPPQPASTPDIRAKLPAGEKLPPSEKRPGVIKRP